MGGVDLLGPPASWKVARGCNLSKSFLLNFSPLCPKIEQLVAHCMKSPTVGPGFNSDLCSALFSASLTHTHCAWLTELIRGPATLPKGAAPFQMLLGDERVAEKLALRRLISSTRLARKAAHCLIIFPSVPGLQARSVKYRCSHWSTRAVTLSEMTFMV